MEIVPKFTTAYSSTGNAIAERTIRSVENVLACYVSNTNQDWSLYLPSATLAINAAINESTGLSPFFLLMGRHPKMPGELGISITNFPSTYLDDLARVREAVKHQLLIAQERSRAAFEKHHLVHAFSLGDYVMISYPNLHKGKSKKLSKNCQYLGPFKVINKLSDQNYEIVGISPPYETQVVHLKRMKPITSRYEHLSLFDPATLYTSDDIPESSPSHSQGEKNEYTTRSGRRVKPNIKYT